jgi:mono/diheme cytochrome c family protein/uncharacterized membrane protein
MTTLALRASLLALPCSRQSARSAVLLLLAAGAMGGVGEVRADTQRKEEQNSRTRALFRQLCQKCHGDDGKGAAARRQFPNIPDFNNDQWQARRGDGQLLADILDGKGIAMPAFHGKITREQARSLVAQVRRFRPPAKGQGKQKDFDKQFQRLQEEYTRLRQESEKLAGSTNRPARPTAPPAKEMRGAKVAPAAKAERDSSGLFRQHCQRCHGADGTGRSSRARLPGIPDFTDPSWQKRQTDAQLLSRVLDGKGSKMPAFREKISEQQARELIAHVRRFRGGEQGAVVPAAKSADEPGKREPGTSGERPTDTLLSQEPEDEPAEAAVEQSFAERLIGWLGRFHPASVHFPIALLLAAAVAEGLSLIMARGVFDSASRYCLWCSALTAPPVAMLGWFLGGFRLADGDRVLTVHRWLGTTTAACAVVVLVLGEVTRRRGRAARWIFRLLLLLIAAVVLATGFFGGALSHGLHYYDWP